VEPTKELLGDIYRERVLRARQTPPEDKLFEGIRLFDFACRVMVDGLRNEHPDADEPRLRELLAQRIALLRRLEDSR
jgi:hypothetical protein